MAPHQAAGVGQAIEVGILYQDVQCKSSSMGHGKMHTYLLLA